MPTSDFLLFADCCRYPSGDDVMHLGYFALNAANGKTSGRYATFSTLANLQAITTPYNYPQPPGSGRIAVPRPCSFSTPSGTFTETGGLLSLKIGTILHTWMVQDPAFSPNYYVSANNPIKGSPWYRGYAWRTPTLQMSQKMLAYDDFYFGYLGPWAGTVNQVWAENDTGFNPYLFTPFKDGSKIWTYGYNPGDPTGLNVYTYALLNWLPANFLPQSNLVFFNGGAHDYNGNHRAGDDYGHTMACLACYSEETQKVEAVLRVECSFEFDGDGIAGAGICLA